MKIKFFLLALCFLRLFAACTEVNPKGNDSAKTLTAKDLEGTWINVAYLDGVAKTHSPRLSFAQSGEISQLNFLPKNLKGDTLVGELSYNGHEGGQYLVVFKAGKQPNSVRFGEYSTDVKETPSDLSIENGVLSITHHDPNEGGRVKAPYRFRRISRSPISLDDGSGVAVVQTLFVGDWLLKDAAGKSTMVSIDSLGNFKGKTNYVKLSVFTDYTGPEVSQDEATILDETKKEPLSVHFKHVGKAIAFSEKKGGKEVSLFTLSMFVK